ncbi:MAG: NYN domain-containing protein [bacterium]|nr:NYN domain-containing protein [bacterium]
MPNLIKHKNQRVAVFIDAQNMYHSARSLFGGRLNFKELLKQAVYGRQLVRAFGYVIRTKTGEEKPFIDALLNLGIETREKDLQEFFGGAKKADWDVGIAVDAIRTAGKVDVIVLASGDGDFIPLVEFLRNRGCRVEVMAFGPSASGKLKEIADEFIDLANEPGKYILKR